MLEKSFRGTAEVFYDPALLGYVSKEMPVIYCIQDLNTGNFIQYNDLFRRLGFERLLQNDTNQLKGNTEKTVELNGEKGDKRYFRIRSRLLTQQNRTLRILTGDEVTREQPVQNADQETEILKTFLGRSPDMTFMADTNGDLEFANPALCHFMGTDMQNIQMELTRDNADFLKGILHRLSTEKQSILSELSILDEDGNRRWINIFFTSRINAAGEFMGLTGTLTDIHLEKNKRDQDSEIIQTRSSTLEEENKNLQRSNDDLEHFAYVASHDMQEPLRKIQIYSERLKQSISRLPAADKIYLHKIQEATSRMTNLIHDLLNYSILTRQKETFYMTDLRGVIRLVVKDYDLLISQTGATVELRNLPVIEANAVMMNQLFYNLIGNSLKFISPDRKPVIRISGRIFMNDQQKDMLEVTVTDNGIGFESNKSDSIFTLFTRLNTRQAFKGSGIGLALCRKIVEAHSGTIQAESDGSNGSVFRITLPVQQAA